MNEQAAHLVDRVLPHGPYRQWVLLKRLLGWPPRSRSARREGAPEGSDHVLTVPGELARVVAFDLDLATTVFGVFADELARWQRERAHDVGLAKPETGSLLEIRRIARHFGLLTPRACGDARGRWISSASQTARGSTRIRTP